MELYILPFEGQVKVPSIVVSTMPRKKEQFRVKKNSSGHNRRIWVVHQAAANGIYRVLPRYGRG
eukprot:5977845-Lingulodinium_polyedra.AAC.1